MTDDSRLTHQRAVFELIERLVDLSAEGREAELAKCDPGVREEVRARLAARASRGDDFLAGMPEVGPPLPAAIGPYHPTELLGEGGMGTVYLAEQHQPVKRRVALKILRFGTLGNQARARFEAERHAMGRLDHPHVGKILEAGTTRSGEPFFAMELIDGPPITVYCDQGSLSVEQRLELFVRVCRGVEHAHHKLLLHRDIKPSNVLVAEVDGRPVPKLIDFGIAKAVDEDLIGATLATADQLIGTPGYMSPEARGLGGDVDTRSDVYSLGVLLYELLTGAQPWAEPFETPIQALQRPADAKLVRPSTRVSRLAVDSRIEVAERRAVDPAELPRQLRQDIDWIALKALAPSPNDRYGSAADLADDIERYLADEPVLAHAPTPAYVIGKLLRRYRRQVIAAAVLVASLILGIVGTTVGFLDAREQRDKALRAQRSSELLVDYLKNLFAEADSSTENPADLSAREILARGSAALELQLRDQPRERAILLRLIGEIQMRWEDLAGAEASLVESLEIFEALAEGGSRPVTGERIEVLEKLATLRFEQGQYELAVTLADRALALDSMMDSVQTARLHNQAGTALLRLNRLEAAEQRLNLSVRLLDGEADSSAARADALGNTHLSLGALAHRRRETSALEHYQRSLASFEQAHGAHSRRIVPALNRLAFWFVDAGRLDQAEDILRRSIDLEQSLFGDTTLALAAHQHHLGRVLNKQERYAEAEKAFRRSAEIKRSLMVEPDPVQANTLALLAYMVWLQHDGRIEEVWALLAEAEQILERDAGVYPIFAAVMGLRARVEIGESRFGLAETSYRRSIEWLEALEEPPMRHLSRVNSELAAVLISLERFDEVRDVCQSSLNYAQRAGRPEYLEARRKELEDLDCL